MLMQVPHLIKSVPNHSDGAPGQRTSPSTSAWMMCWTSACLLRTPPHPSLGLARPTCTDYTNGLPCPLPLNPAYGEPGRRSERGRAMSSRPQLFPSGVMDQTAALGVSTQPSVWVLVTVLSPHLFRPSCYQPSGITLFLVTPLPWSIISDTIYLLNSLTLSQFEGAL